jgi:hypothetical protein
MHEMATLADTVYRSTLDGKSWVGVEVRTLLHRARRFVLEADMSAFIADLAWAAYKAKPKLSSDIFDDARRMARLPHSVTWIEWDEIAVARRAMMEYGSNMDPLKVPKKSGWLMWQHPQVDTAFLALNFGIGTTNFGDAGGLPDGVLSLGSSPFGIQWRTDDGPLMWPQLPDAVHFSELRRISQGAMLSGLTSYVGNGNMSFATTPKGIFDFGKRQFPSTEVRQMLAESFGMMRYLLPLLATINDLPVSVNTVATGKGYVARGRYRKFLDHTTITLKVPTERHRSLARRTVSQLRRRAHEVRGHWRDDWRNPGNPACEHIFDTEAETGNLVCRNPLCRKRRIWIAEHQRGDGGIGFVTHDYVVKRGEPVS